MSSRKPAHTTAPPTAALRDPDAPAAASGRVGAASRRPAAVEVSVSWGVPADGLPDEKLFREWVAAAVGRQRAAAEVSLRIVDAAEGQALNLQYRHRDYATNVLSFPADLPTGLGIPLLGDLVLCAPVIASEALAQGKTVLEHWAHLTVHGTLHLLGHVHETPVEARDMEALEVQVLEKLGIPDPYVAR
ncbi:MAG: rRNA maturation RNase YbeY [Pseudomonadota bacterium]|jgi:probable rRNA maturation factor